MVVLVLTGDCGSPEAARVGQDGVTEDTVVSMPAESVDARVPEGPGARADTTAGPSVMIRDSADDGGVANRPIWIEGGTFSMGTDDGPDSWGPVHEVTVSSFWIQRHEVTNAEFLRFDSTHYSTGSADDPVVYVQWGDALAYAGSLGGSLPTEAQWEFAARGREGRTYPWGEASPSCALAHYEGCEPRGTLPVMSLPAGATPEGIQDLAGNVAEWVLDRYGSYPAGPVTDPGGPEVSAEPTERRVLRGGAWDLGPEYLPGFARTGWSQVTEGEAIAEMWIIGFRVAWPGDAGPDSPPTSEMRER